MRTKLLLAAAAVAAAACAAPGATTPQPTAAVSVVLRMTNPEYLMGERVRGEVEIRNGSTSPIVVGASDSTDFVLLELFKNDTSHSVERYSERKVTRPFVLKSGEAQTFEVFFVLMAAARTNGRARPQIGFGFVSSSSMMSIWFSPFRRNGAGQYMLYCGPTFQ